MKIMIPHTLPEHLPYVVRVRRMGDCLVNKVLGVVAKRTSPRKWEVIVHIPGHVSEKAKVMR